MQPEKQTSKQLHLKSVKQIIPIQSNLCETVTKKMKDNHSYRQVAP